MVRKRDKGKGFFLFIIGKKILFSLVVKAIVTLGKRFDIHFRFMIDQVPFNVHLRHFIHKEDVKGLHENSICIYYLNNVTLMSYDQI